MLFCVSQLILSLTIIALQKYIHSFNIYFLVFSVPGHYVRLIRLGYEQTKQYDMLTLNDDSRLHNRIEIKRIIQIIEYW